MSMVPLDRAVAALKRAKQHLMTVDYHPPQGPSASKALVALQCVDEALIHLQDMAILPRPEPGAEEQGFRSLQAAVEACGLRIYRSVDNPPEFTVKWRHENNGEPS